MAPQTVFAQINEHFEEVTTQSTQKGRDLLEKLKKLHHADIAQYLASLSRNQFDRLFMLFDEHQQLDIYPHLQKTQQANALAIVNDQQRVQFLGQMDMDDIFDLADFATEDELKRYVNLLHRKDREKVLGLLELAEDSAGAVMELNVLTLNENLTVARSIQILQRLKPRQELHRIIYVTDPHNKLLGHIELQDLVIKSPETTIASFMKPNELVVTAEEKQEEIALKMRHYHLTSVPVVGKHQYFLGAITDEQLVDILEEEASEDILRISAMTTIKHTYFETPFLKMLIERGAILVILMFAESFSSVIINHYEALLVGCGLWLFAPMLISTGGNTSTQTSAVVVQGLASGEINETNIGRFLRREFLMAFCLALGLGIAALARVYFLGNQTIEHSLAVAASIVTVVVASVTMGSGVPFILRKIGIDPAFAAAPFLATGIDILGLFLYCLVSKYLLAII